VTRVVVAALSASHDGAGVLDAVDLEAEPGATLVVAGPSGCGKTTLLRCLAGLHRPDAGTVRIDTVVVDGPGVQVPAERRGIGLVFQDGAIFPHLDVSANVAFGLPRAERTGPRVAETLELVGLGGLASRMPDQLSGGQRQRVALARALAPRPTVLLLDEPFSNLDAPMRAELRAEVGDLLASLGTTSILVTHDRDEAFALGDRMVLLRDGRVVASGTPAGLYRDPPDEWTARFLGEVNVGADGSMVRPEDLDLVPGDAGVVTAVVFGGALTRVTVDVGGRLLVVATARTGLVVGDRIGVEPRVR
jgi:iron(III) transport system ATP-binding protein